MATAPTVEAENAQTELAERWPLRILVPYLLAAIALAMAYGSSFLLADALPAAGLAPSSAGTVVGAGVIATLVGAAFAGRWAERMGILPLIAGSCVLMTAAMVCFALIPQAGMPIAVIGGLLLGIGWAIFYMMAPIQVVQSLRPSARLEALTLLSGSQMLGMGFSAPLGHWLSRHSGGMTVVFAIYAAACVLAGGLVLLTRQRLARYPQLALKAVALSLPAIVTVLKARTVLPVLLMGIAACTFTGLSTFQSLYGQSRGLSPDLFFITFTVTTVVLRFTIAPWIGRLPLGRLAMGLFMLTLCSIALLIINRSSAALYIAATVLFAAGYGLTYATLNAMVVNLAEAIHISVPVASQVFTLGYFTGAFGFPYVAGTLIAHSGINLALFIMLALVVLNLGIAATAPGFRQLRR
ncbi:MAG: MFS transporter [Comamonas sp.]|jgi:MFS family permease|uniref:MFS transporter n=1 Tax=Comamonas sp. TaxID=34028 RepID=UPI00282AA84F|nr:MFS transporter [Comamonas sp.]MDR0214631.1 MFS transporter [Comamonas sp.]